MTINLIAAIGRRGQIGRAGGLPWQRQEEDLCWFRRQTEGGILIMGERTLRALGWNEGPLGGDRIVTAPMPRVAIYTAEKHIAHLLGDHPGRTIWVAGGAATYRLFAPHVERLFISRIDYDGPADAWFPFDAYGIGAAA